MNLHNMIIESLDEKKTYVAPVGAIKSAQKAIDWRDKYGRKVVDGGTRIGWERANQIVNKENLSLDTIKRMKAFFDRHQKNKTIDPKYKNEPYRDNGYIAWLIWGGDSAYSWVKGILKDK